MRASAAKVHPVSLWPWHLTSDLESLFSNAQSHDEYLCQVLFKSLHAQYKEISHKASGVTRVGDNRGGNWGCHPLFFLKNLATFFAHRCHYHYRFLLLSLGCHPHHGGVSPFLPVRSRFFTVLCKFVHKNFFLRVSPPGWCHPGRSAAPPHPPSDATASSEIGVNGQRTDRQRRGGVMLWSDITGLRRPTLKWWAQIREQDY